MPALLDESGEDPDGEDRVLITGVASTTASFMGGIELRECEEWFATITEGTFSRGEGWLAPSGLGRAREAFTFWAEEGLVWFVFWLIT